MADYVSAEEPTLYKTRDLYECAVLRAMDIPIVRVEKNDHDIVEFYFGGGKQVCEHICLNYRNREVMVNARDLVEAIRTVKEMMYTAIGR